MVAGPTLQNKAGPTVVTEGDENRSTSEPVQTAGQGAVSNQAPVVAPQAQQEEKAHSGGFFESAASGISFGLSEYGTGDIKTDTFTGKAGYVTGMAAGFFLPFGAVGRVIGYGFEGAQALYRIAKVGEAAVPVLETAVPTIEAVVAGTKTAVPLTRVGEVAEAVGQKAVPAVAAKSAEIGAAAESKAIADATQASLESGNGIVTAKGVPVLADQARVVTVTTEKAAAEVSVETGKGLAVVDEGATAASDVQKAVTVADQGRAVAVASKEVKAVDVAFEEVQATEAAAPKLIGERAVVGAEGKAVVVEENAAARGSLAAKGENAGKIGHRVARVGQATNFAANKSSSASSGVVTAGMAGELPHAEGAHSSGKGIGSDPYVDVSSKEKPAQTAGKAAQKVKKPVHASDPKHRASGEGGGRSRQELRNQHSRQPMHGEYTPGIADWGFNQHNPFALQDKLAAEQHMREGEHAQRAERNRSRRHHDDHGPDHHGPRPDGGSRGRKGPNGRTEYSNPGNS
jgi:hypothetical protein